MMIRSVKNLDITILLGNFHTQMSYLSSIGYVMQSSGVKKMLSLIFAENSVDKIISGQALVRNTSDMYHTSINSCLPLDFSCEEKWYPYLPILKL